MTRKIWSAAIFTVIGFGAGIAAGFFWSFGNGEEGAPSAEAEVLLDLPYRSGPYRFDITIEPEKPVVGDNALTFTLTTDDGQPVSGAALDIVAEMPAMGAMPAMQAPVEIEEFNPGVYRGAFYLPMDGAWPLTVKIEKAELGHARITFDMASGRPGLRLTSGAVAADATRPDAPAGGMVESSAALPPGSVAIDNRRRQLIGLETAVAEMMPLTRTVRAYGEVSYDETRLSDISLKFDAWIGTLHADFIGKFVERGDVLFTIFSPELYSTQQEYLELIAHSAASPLLAATRTRLKFWGLTEEQIDELAARGKPLEYVPVLSSREGVVVSKSIVEGSGVKAGSTLMRIADLSSVWIEARVYEDDLRLIRNGDSAEIAFPHSPHNTLTGRVEYIYPYLDGESRTGLIRLSFSNPEGLLRPEMYAEVHFRVPLEPTLSIPEEAILFAGETRVVFEDLGDGHLAPRHVKIGHQADGYVQILSGLEPGDVIVTSGNFLIASESRLKSGLKQW